MEMESLSAGSTSRDKAHERSRSSDVLRYNINNVERESEGKRKSEKERMDRITHHGRVVRDSTRVSPLVPRSHAKFTNLNELSGGGIFPP